MFLKTDLLTYIYILENPDLNPNMFVDEKCVQQFKSKYMFLGCIDFIMQVKKGLFHEHSNQLWNISGVQSWNKINEGLIKMYKKEVKLSKKIYINVCNTFD